jgi:hypothetical protein
MSAAQQLTDHSMCVIQGQKLNRNSRHTPLLLQSRQRTICRQFGEAGDRPLPTYRSPGASEIIFAKLCKCFILRQVEPYRKRSSNRQKRKEQIGEGHFELGSPQNYPDTRLIEYHDPNERTTSLKVPKRWPICDLRRLQLLLRIDLLSSIIS